MKGRTQVFNVRLAPVAQTPLGEPTDLKNALKCIGQHGHLCTALANPDARLPPVLTRYTGHVLSIVVTVLSVGLFILVGLFLLRHFKLWTANPDAHPPPDYLGYNGDNNRHEHVDLYPLSALNLAPRL